MPKPGNRSRVVAVAGLALAATVVVATLVASPGAVLGWCAGIVAAAAAAYLSQDIPRHIKGALAGRQQRAELDATAPVTVMARVRDQDYVVLTDADATVEIPAAGPSGTEAHRPGVQRCRRGGAAGR